MQYEHTESAQRKASNFYVQACTSTYCPWLSQCNHNVDRPLALKVDGCVKWHHCQTPDLALCSRFQLRTTVLVKWKDRCPRHLQHLRIWSACCPWNDLLLFWLYQCADRWRIAEITSPECGPKLKSTFERTSDCEAFCASFQLQPQRPSTDAIIVSPMNMSKPSQSDLPDFISKTNNTSCPSDVLTPDPIHPLHSQREHQHLELCNLPFCLLSFPHRRWL